MYGSSPLLRVSLQAELHKVMKVGTEGSVIGVLFSVGVTRPSGPEALTDAGVGPRARGL